MIKPKKPNDLALAPVAAEIDLNLQPLRDAPPDVIVDQVALALNTEPAETRAKRAKQILEFATRHVDLRGWKATISKDSTRVELRGGSVRLDLGLSQTIRGYIESAS